MNASRTELQREFEERLSRLGYDLVQVEWAGRAHHPIIRLRVERTALDRPVSLGDCTAVSRGMEAWLDSDVRMPDRYVLEVSSPGLDRPLTRARDFRRFRGRKIAVQGTGPLSGDASRIEGTLLGFAGDGEETGSILLRLSGGHEIEVPRSRVAKARLIHEWSA